MDQRTVASTVDHEHADARLRQATRVARVHRSARERAHAAARGLGWFSIGLGLAELLAPRALARATGMQRRSPTLLRLCGLREIGAGIGLLTARDKRPWLWARVAGDALDLALVGDELDAGNARRGHALGALAAVGGATLMDLGAIRQQEQQARQQRAAAFDYSDRVGLALAPDQMRGKARAPETVSG
jgi:hypothetical protein